MRYTQSFDKAVHFHLPPSTASSIGLIVKPCKTSREFRIIRTSVSGFAYVDNILLLSVSYRELHDLLEAGNRRAKAVGMRNNALKTKVVLVLILVSSGIGKPLENADKCK